MNVRVVLKQIPNIQKNKWNMLVGPMRESDIDEIRQAFTRFVDKFIDINPNEFTTWEEAWGRFERSDTYVSLVPRKMAELAQRESPKP